MHTDRTSPRKALVERYCDGFRAGDHAVVLATLTDDVAWDLPGFRHLRGKTAFDTEIENPTFTGRPRLHVDRLVEEGETVVAVGSGRAALAAGGHHDFAFCDVFTFRAELIARVESYVVALSGT
jgi:ketosteroid isomerase-like protein